MVKKMREEKERTAVIMKSVGNERIFRLAFSADEMNEILDLFSKVNINIDLIGYECKSRMQFFKPNLNKSLEQILTEEI